jgi:hypothetical protein
MLLLNFFIVLFVAIIAVPIAKHQYIQFDHCYMDCQDRWLENERIKHMEACQNPKKRIEHGPKLQKICATAERENRFGPLPCAWITWWTQSEPYKLYNRIFDSTWKLFALILPIIYLWFKHRAEARAQERLYAHQYELFAQVKSLKEAPPPPPPVLLHDRHKLDKIID